MTWTLCWRAEWAANSYADDCLDVYGVRHPLVYDSAPARPPSVPGSNRKHPRSTEWRARNESSRVGHSCRERLVG